MSVTVLITGCSSGIGQALAQEFQRRGHKVIATARKPEALQALSAQGMQALALDVNDAQSIAAAVAALQGQAIDILINNAGYGQFGALLDISAEELRQQFETNVVAPLELVRAFLPLLRKSTNGNGGLIANVGSISGLVTTPFAGAYCASKAAIHALSDAWRMELAPLGLRVVTIQPGGIASSFGNNAGERVSLPPGSLYSKIAKRIEGRASMSQVDATPADEFARTVVDHLLRPDAPPICRTGHQSTRLPLLKRLLPLRTLDSKMRSLFGLDQL